ncbi:MAG TPA: class I SAM-dependent methyltransferase [Caldithrix abyssi]|uniref:Class I SAM-dependent methyltransferase n=1 Tax=Caldithrix abyssi TaxID=187145 RepID=A0A7V1LND7_CALAY|nr:class I SAM-dependent methyltransferase [Caldithrix abyssi]
MHSMDGYNPSWYKEWFGEDYLTVYKHRDNSDARRLTALILRHCPVGSGGKVLDLACGNGRHSFLLARHFSTVIGLDLSAHLLRVAQNSRKSSACPCFVRGDMRLLPFKSGFDLVASLFTSFGYFDDDAQHRQVAGEIARVLRPGAYFVIDYFNAAYVRDHLVAEGERVIEGRIIREKRWIEGGRVNKKILIEKDGRIKSFLESVRMFSGQELVNLFTAAGIETQHMFGDYDGSALTPSSPRMIIFGKKR